VVAALVESPSELFYMHSLNTNQVHKRLLAEAISILLKSITSYLMLVNGYGLIAYAVGSLVYSLCLNGVYVVTTDWPGEERAVSKVEHELVKEFS